MHGFITTQRNSVKYFYLILLCTLLLSVGSNMSIPFMAIYLNNVVGATPIEIGMFISAGFFAYSLFGFPLGSLIDKGNQKLILLACVVMLICSMLIFFLSKNIYLFYIANLIIGISQAGFNTIVSLFITENINEEEKYTAFSFKYIIVNAGASIGPLLGAYFAKIGSKYFLLFTIVFYLTSLIIILFWLQLKNIKQTFKVRIKHKFVDIFSNKFFLVFLLGSVIYNICYSQYTSTFPLYIKSVISNWAVVYTTMLVINSLGVVLLQYPVTLVMNKFTTSNSFIIGSTIFGFSFLLFAFSNEDYLFYLAMLLFTLGEIILSPLSSVLIDKIAPENQKGAYFGAYNLSFFGSSLGPVIGGSIFQFTNGVILYLFITIASICMLFLFFVSSYGSRNKFAFE